MATPNLAIPHIAASQNQKEVTANDAFDALDQAMNDTGVVDCSAGDTGVDAATFTRNFELVLTGTPATAFTLTVPDGKRFFLVRNATAQTATVQRTSGGAAVAVAASERQLLYGDGAGVRAAGGAGSFLGLTDAPATYAGQGGKAAIVKASEDGLEFGEVSDGGGGGAAGTVQAFRGARVVKTAAQAVPDAAFTRVTFDAASFDTGGFVGAAGDTITIPPGVSRVVIEADVAFTQSGTAGQRIAQIRRVADGRVLAQERSHGVSVVNPLAYHLATGAIAVTAGEEYELVAFADGGSGDTVNGLAASDEVHMSVHVLDAQLPVASIRKARVSRASSDFALTVGAFDKVEWDTEDEDTGGWADLAAGSTKLIVPAGVSRVRVTANVALASAGGDVQMRIVRNGTVESGLPFHRNSSGGLNYSLVSAIIDVSAGDAFEVEVSTSSGTPAVRSDLNNSWFSIEAVDGPALVNVGKAEAFGGARLERTADQSLPADIQTPLQWQTEIFERGRWADLAANNTRLTVPEGVSVVEVTFGLVFSASATGDRTMQIRRNGTDVLASAKWDASGASDAGVITSGPLEVQPGDTFEAIGTPNGVTVNAVGSAQTFFAIKNLDSGVVPSLPDGAHVRNGLAQSIATGAWTALGFDAEDFDTKGFHDTAANNSRITVPGGVTHVRLAARAAFAANATGVRGLRITRNGSVFDQGAKALVPAAGGADETVVTISTGLIEVAVGDTFEAEAFQTSGAGLDVQADSWLNVEAVTGVAAPAFRGALVRKTVAQSIPSDAETALAWDAETYDTDGIHDNVTNNSRLTVPSAARRVRLGLGLRWGNNSSGRRYAFMKKNGAAFPGFPAARENAHENSEKLLWSPVLSVAAGDYFEAFVNQNSGAGLNVEAADSTWFAMEIVE